MESALRFLWFIHSGQLLEHSESHCYISSCTAYEVADRLSQHYAIDSEESWQDDGEGHYDDHFSE